MKNHSLWLLNVWEVQMEIFHSLKWTVGWKIAKTESKLYSPTTLQDIANVPIHFLCCPSHSSEFCLKLLLYSAFWHWPCFTLHGGVPPEKTTSLEKICILINTSQMTPVIGQCRWHPLVIYILLYICKC